VLLLHCKTIEKRGRESEFYLWGKKEEREREERGTDHFWRSDMFWPIP